MVLPILIYVFGAVGAAIAGADPYSVELEAFIKCEMALGPGAPRIDLSHHSFVWTSRVDGNDSKMRQFRSHVEAALAKSRRTPIPISWNGVSKYLATFVQLGDRPNRLIRVNYNLEPRRIVRIDRAARVESEFDHDLKRMSNYRSIHADFGEWRISIAAFDGARAAHATVDDVRFALSHPLAPAVFHSTENNYALHVGRTPVGTALKILTSFNLSLNLLTIVDVVACNNEQVENFPMLRRLIDPVHDERIPIPVTGSLAGLRIRTPNDLHQKLARKWRVSWPALIEACAKAPAPIKNIDSQSLDFGRQTFTSRLSNGTLLRVIFMMKHDEAHILAAYPVAQPPDSMPLTQPSLAPSTHELRLTKMAN